MNLYAYCGGQPVGNADPSGLMDWTSFSRWMFTGDADASDEAFEAGIRQAGRTFGRWDKHFSDENVRFWPAVMGCSAAGTAPYWSMKKPSYALRPGARPFTSAARGVQIRYLRRLGMKEGVKRGEGLIGKQLGRLARGVKGNIKRYGKWGSARGAAAGFLAIEAVLAWRAAIQTMNEPIEDESD